MKRGLGSHSLRGAHGALGVVLGRSAESLGEFRWGWVDYEHQLASLCLDVEGFPDFRLFVWVNDFAFAGLRTIHILAVNPDGQTYLQGEGMDILLRRRVDVILQLMGGAP